MKNCLLEGLHDAAAVCAALDDVVPGQTDPWLVTTAIGDAIAYLDVREGVADKTQGPFVVQADVSGRHFRAAGRSSARVLPTVRVQSMRSAAYNVAWRDIAAMRVCGLVSSLPGSRPWMPHI